MNVKRQRTRRGFPLFWLLFGGLAGGVCGTFVVRAGAEWQVLANLIACGIGIGGMIGFLESERAELNSRLRPEVKLVRETLPPPGVESPFTQRLAKFTGQPDREVRSAEESPSRMPFWCLVRPFRWHGPKPTWEIRQLLQRIREGVRIAGHRR